MATTGKKLAIGVASASLTGVALAMGVPGTGGAVAAAMSTKPPPVNADNYTLSCQQVSGKELFSPHLHSSGASGLVTAKFKLKMSNCTAQSPTGGQPVAVSSATLKGTFSVPNNGCNGLLDGMMAGGVLTKKVKTAVGTPKLTEKEGSFSVNSVQGSQDTNGNYIFEIPGVGLPAVQSNGPFSGTDGGTSSHISVNGGPVSIVVFECSGRAGLKGVTFGDGSAFFG